MQHRTIGAAILAALLGLIAGCGNNGKPEMVPVTGKVMFNKTTPAAGAFVVFHPANADTEKRIGGKPFATAGEDGTFKLTTYGEADGAPEGEYGITVEWHRKEGKEPTIQLKKDKGGKSALKPKYGNPQSPFMKATIKKGEKNDFLIEVD
jgi:hypothetical protein